MNLAIAIILAAVTVGLGVCIMFTVRIVNELNFFCERMDRRIEFMKKLEKENREKRTQNTEFVDGVRKEILKRLQEQRGINVVDKPLDFPNDNKEGN